MNISDMKIYIAAPFFTPNQLEAVKEIEKTLDLYNINYFSPRHGGVIMNMDEMEKEQKMEAIYNANISNLEECNVMIAVIDDYDTGTVFELGYFTKLKFLWRENKEKTRKIITMTWNDYNLNVMLKFGTDCHLRSVTALIQLMCNVRKIGLQDVVLKSFDDSPEVKT